jgi:deazaflavin-dependent oxidoreductase (nitroreductase family)
MASVAVLIVGQARSMPDDEPLDSALEWVADHTRRYVESGGADGHDWKGVPTLVLTTRGRRSGQLRRNALIYGEDRGRHVIVASKGGWPNNPAWYLNLVDEPRVGVQVGADTFDATARTVDGDERARLWTLMAAIWPAYDEYQSKTDRQIPVVVLEPA